MWTRGTERGQTRGTREGGETRPHIQIPGVQVVIDDSMLIKTKHILREPKNRATWLKIWYNTIEKIEKENPWALAFNEEEETDARSKAL